MKEKFPAPTGGAPTPESGVFKMKKSVIESLDWGDFGDINGDKKSTNNPFEGYKTEPNSVERELTPREEEHLWREVHWKYPRIRGRRPFLLEPGVSLGAKEDEQGPIYNEEEKEKARHLFEKQKQVYLHKQKSRLK